MFWMSYYALINIEKWYTWYVCCIKTTCCDISPASLSMLLHLDYFFCSVWPTMHNSLLLHVTQFNFPCQSLTQMSVQMLTVDRNITFVTIYSKWFCVTYSPRNHQTKHSLIQIKLYNTGFLSIVFPNKSAERLPNTAKKQTRNSMKACCWCWQTAFIQYLYCSTDKNRYIAVNLRTKGQNSSKCLHVGHNVWCPSRYFRSLSLVCYETECTSNKTLEYLATQYSSAK